MTRHILLIDDDDDIREVARTALEVMRSWTVTEATDGPAGHQAARTSTPDLILLDYMMPGEDGGATLRRLKEDPETRAIPVIILTAKGRSAVAALIDTGAAGILEKPFDPLTLGDDIATIAGWTD